MKDSYIGPTYFGTSTSLQDIILQAPRQQIPRKIHQEWTTSSMTWLYPSSYNATSLACSAATGGGSYAAIYIPVKLAETSTSTTWTETRTYQTTATTLPVFVPRWWNGVGSKFGIYCIDCGGGCYQLAVLFGQCQGADKRGSEKIR